MTVFHAAAARVIAKLVLRAEHAERENRQLREAIASALTSLATGPAKDGYAYATLDAALASPAVPPPPEKLDRIAARLVEEHGETLRKLDDEADEVARLRRAEEGQT